MQRAAHPVRAAVKSAWFGMVGLVGLWLVGGGGWFGLVWLVGLWLVVGGGGRWDMYRYRV